jgi:hypothetical protein
MKKPWSVATDGCLCAALYYQLSIGAVCVAAVEWCLCSGGLDHAAAVRTWLPRTYVCH